MPQADGYEGWLGIDPDYDNKIPESKNFEIAALIEKLNKESMPWEKVHYSAHLAIDWVWQTDTLLPSGIYVTLRKSTETIGQLETTIPWNNFIVSDFIPHLNCTVGDIKFIRECTGWKIEI